MPRRPAMLSEDITVQRMIKERDSERVILIAQVIPAMYIGASLNPLNIQKQRWCGWWRRMIR